MSRDTPPCIFSAKSCGGIFSPRISPLSSKLLHMQSGSRSLWWNGSARTKQASTETLNISRSIANLFKPLGCPLLNLSTANADRPQEQWTRQLLRGSALLRRPSTLKLASLPLALVASLRLAFFGRRRLALRARLPPPPSSKLLHS